MGISINNTDGNSVTAMATGKGTAINKTGLSGYANDSNVAADKQQQNGNGPQVDERDLQQITDQLNDFMQSLNTSIHFELHRETETLMVQVEDSQTHKIIKEVPSSELLDMVAKLKESIGAFVDKKV